VKGYDGQREERRRKRRRSLFVFNDTIAELFNLGYGQQEKRLGGGRRVSRRRYQWRMRACASAVYPINPIP
jgi:hypothetical protein